MAGRLVVRVGQEPLDWVWLWELLLETLEVVEVFAVEVEELLVEFELEVVVVPLVDVVPAVVLVEVVFAVVAACWVRFS